MKIPLLALSTAFLFMACTDYIPFISDSGGCAKQRTVCLPPDYNDSLSLLVQECRLQYDETFNIDITNVSTTDNSLDIDFINKLDINSFFQINFTNYEDFNKNPLDYSYEVSCLDNDCNRYNHLHCNYDTEKINESIFACNIDEELFFNIENVKKASIYFSFYVTTASDIEGCRSYSETSEFVDFRK